MPFPDKRYIDFNPGSNAPTQIILTADPVTSELGKIPLSDLPGGTSGSGTQGLEDVIIQDPNLTADRTIDLNSNDLTLFEGDLILDKGSLIGGAGGNLVLDNDRNVYWGAGSTEYVSANDSTNIMSLVTNGQPGIEIGADQSVNMPAYGSGSITGTPTKAAAWDSAGKLIETNLATNNPQSKAITIEVPLSTENIGFFYARDAITIQQCADVVNGASPSVTYQINHHTDRSSGSPNTLFSSSRTVTSQSGSTTTTFNDATIPAGSWVWITTSAVSGTVNSIDITLTYTID